MKKSISLKTVIFAFMGELAFMSCCAAYDYDNTKYVNVVNNSEEIQTVEYHNRQINLVSGQNIEIKTPANKISLTCNYGEMKIGDLEFDTTVEINPDCYYVGETRYEF